MFGPYVGPAVTELVKIIGEADTLESKRRVAGSLNTVIAQAETRVNMLNLDSRTFFADTYGRSFQ